MTGLRTVPALIVVSIVVGSCGQTSARLSGDARHQPGVQFWIIPRVGSADPATQRFDSIWSQNQEVDSIAILLTGADGMKLPLAVLELIADSSVEGDGYMAYPTTRTLVWHSLRDVVVDSLEPIHGSRRLLDIRPSLLWDRVQADVGKHFRPSALRVRLEFGGGGTFTRTLEFLWD